jgi:hypothetical protein
VNPDFAKTGDPEFPKTVTVEPATYEAPSTGTLPLTFVLPLYVTVYVGGVFLQHPYALLCFANPDRFFPAMLVVIYFLFIVYINIIIYE